MNHESRTAVAAPPAAPRPSSVLRIPLHSDYDLAATLDCGQAFRWRQTERGWTGMIGARPVCLRANGPGLEAETPEPVPDWHWLTGYLQTDVDLLEIHRTFPDDPPMRAAVAACRGLRLLRQDPWECLASFILSSTKQIVQIRQIVESLCARFGEERPGPGPGPAAARTFPSAARLATLSEAELRACKMGFRAPYLLAAARSVAAGELALARLGTLPADAARAQLMQLPGVGPKIADCVLLFAYGFQDAFPLDVWMLRALRQLYFRGRTVKLPRLRRFAAGHFGPYGGYAQQYLFHYIRNAG